MKAEQELSVGSVCVCVCVCVLVLVPSMSLSNKSVLKRNEFESDGIFISVCGFYGSYSDIKDVGEKHLFHAKGSNLIILVCVSVCVFLFVCVALLICQLCIHS